MQEQISVLGAGSWGTALALVLADNGHRVRIWGNRPDTIGEINAHHTNRDYLPGVTLPNTIQGYTSLSQALASVNTILLAVPTVAITEVCQQVAKTITHRVTIVHASKGIEPESLQRISQIIAATIPPHLRRGIVVLSGPSHAEEVSRRQPTTIVAAAEDLALAEEIQVLFINQYFRVYTHPDVVGVEIGGALKNVIALGAGMSDGMGLGDNAKAALITRGLAEMARLGIQLGANPLTFLGLTGVGDLVVTCTSRHSRNWQAGYLFGQGLDLPTVLARMKMVVEGIPTIKAAFRLSQREQIEMPITSALYQVVYAGQHPHRALETLMERARTQEMADLSLSYRQRLLVELT